MCLSCLLSRCPQHTPSHESRYSLRQHPFLMVDVLWGNCKQIPLRGFGTVVFRALLIKRGMTWHFPGGATQWPRNAPTL